jgi:GDP-L-fucose synthase
LREYTYAPDLAKIYMWALDNYNDAQCLNIGSVEEHSVKDIACMIADAMGIGRGRIIFDISKPGGVHRKSTDNSKLIKLSGFRYTPLREGLKKTVEWFIDAYENRPDTVNLKGKYGST